MLESTLITFENWIMRVRPGTGKRILLLLHGWTGDENSMTIFTRNFPVESWIISPRAPYPATSGGFSWRAPAPRGSLPSVDLFRPSINVLIDMIDKWAQTNNLDSSIVDVVGFSQGGALTFTFGILFPARVRKMGILAGFAPEGAEDIISPKLLYEKSIFVAHGILDEMVPFSMAEQTINLLELAGANVIFSKSEVGHKLSGEGLKALEQYLAK